LRAALQSEEEGGAHIAECRRLYSPLERQLMLEVKPPCPHCLHSPLSSRVAELAIRFISEGWPGGLESFRGRARPPEGPGVPNFVTSGGDYLAADIGRCGCPNFRHAWKFFMKTRDPRIFSQIPPKWPFVARAAAKGGGELMVLREKDRGTIGGRNPGCAPRNRPRPCIFLLTLVSCFPSFATGPRRKL
jgi:hypothetical protein